MTGSNAPALSPEGLQELRSLVAHLDRHHGPWGEWRGGEKTGENSFTMPYMVLGKLAAEAMRFLYDHDLIIRFAWPKWDEGREMFRRENADRFALLDRQTVLKLLTAVARNDRFNEGAWAALFEVGDAQLLFRRLLEIEEGAVRAAG